MIAPIVGVCQYDNENESDSVLSATRVYDEPEHLSFVSLQAFPFSVQNNLSSTSISFGAIQHVMIKSKLIITGKMLKAYSDEFINQNDGSTKSLSVYKERSVFEWAASLEYALIKNWMRPPDDSK